MSEFVNIDDKLSNSKDIIAKRENPIVYVFILLASVATGIYSLMSQDGDNIAFGILFTAIVLALIGLKGVLLPRKVLKYAPTNERIVKQEYYYDGSERKEVEDCLKAKGFETLKLLPQGKGTTLRVILYTTISGSYTIGQLQNYVPYEYRPVLDVE